VVIANHYLVDGGDGDGDTGHPPLGRREQILEVDDAAKGRKREALAAFPQWREIYVRGWLLGKKE
jgi:hypothetical protein